MKSDDALVRGGYCAVLCHEQAGVKLKDTVMFGTQKLPHIRHVSEFGAVCTVCHSAEVHKAFTAKAATCSGCHHSPDNERCESCHRAQAAFYRGEAKTPLAKVEPNVMVNAVTCVGCHDVSKKQPPRETVEAKCVGCHDKGYAAFMSEWTTGLDKEVTRAADAIKRAEASVGRGRRNGRAPGDADALLKEAREALALVKKAKGVHNPSLAQALVDGARQKADRVLGLRSSR
jgi:cytochrome c7-like protein